jgi:hypothetical protein
MTRQGTLARLKAAFPRQPVPAETFALYLRELGDVPPEVLDRAVSRLIRTQTNDRWPTVGALREACAEEVLALPSESAALRQVNALARWRARDPLERAGSAPDVHPLVREALTLVGGTLAFRTADEPGVIRGQFGRLYRDLRAEHVHDAQIGRTLEAAPERPALEPPQG